ncbi:lipoprotein signal peptidase [Solimonas sp. K1W22B-7]|uniref:signal peptidase II n=1 Tax=Solimonas sp. K1W22B-7 TaxID=2303331 RepID=UPI000E332E25|nr:signal peptidase II [Solimonas sp. K1W22B-7]AXQ28955.1 lipoprotein signal peptidase [Solimonas sp. K1W22B-7]
MSFQYKNVYWLWLSAAIIVLDQVTKQLIVKTFAEFESLALLPSLNLRHVTNTGAAFSMMSDMPPFAFVLLGTVVSVGILVWMRSNPAGQRLVAVALALILGGALGNVIDRATRGHVVDFIDFYVGNWHFPAFNVADIAISFGAGFLILDMLLDLRRGRMAATPGK